MNRELPFRGHQESLRFLLELHHKGRLPHALLFIGPEGIGKAKLAKYLAGAILCQGDSPPCGACGPCKLQAEDKHPDFLQLVPENNRIKIDAIRELSQNFSFAPLMGTRRVIFLPEAHLMNSAAANALLKTLEEPPADTFFLLVTHAAGWIPRTILSRCQKIRMKPLGEADLVPILEAAGISADADTLAKAQGSAGLAIRMAGLGDLPDLEDCVDTARSLSAERAFSYAQQVVDAEKLEPFLEGLLGEARRRLLGQAAGTDLSFDLLCFTDKILEMRRRLKVNINAKMALTRLLLFFREPLESRLES